MPKYSKIAILFLLTMLLFDSCASRKKTVAPAPPQSFEWLTANLSIQAEGNGMAYNDLSGQLRMRKDSIVWVSVTATMGVEVLQPNQWTLFRRNWAYRSACRWCKFCFWTIIKALRPLKTKPFS